jgi:hypothetical protein
MARVNFGGCALAGISGGCLSGEPAEDRCSGNAAEVLVPGGEKTLD